jgi:hypothetical protein
MAQTGCPKTWLAEPPGVHEAEVSDGVGTVKG